MAKYSKFRGRSVISREEDFSAAYGTSGSSFEGQLYYNTSDGQIKYIGVAAGTWATGGSLNQGRNSGNITGDHSASMFAGGEHPSQNASNLVETYNGSSWTEITEINTGRGGPALVNTGGIDNVLLISGGVTPLGSSNPTTNVESWNGSSWTETTEVNTGSLQVEAFGRSDAAIKVGGYAPSMTDSVENWNGTSWTEVNEINTATVGHGAFGISTSGAIAGGSPTPNDTRHESWNGSSWTETTELNTGRSYLGSGGASSSSGMIFAGTESPPAQSAKTEIWDGTSWTESGDLGQTAGEGRGNSQSIASGMAKLDNPGKSQTEEWTFEHAFKKVTTS